MPEHVCPECGSQKIRREFRVLVCEACEHAWEEPNSNLLTFQTPSGNLGFYYDPDFRELAVRAEDNSGPEVAVTRITLDVRQAAELYKWLNGLRN